MISVVIATYNGEKYIVEQLESIRNQQVSADEVIIRDDGSTDMTVLIVKKYIEKYHLNNWDFKKNKKNKGYKQNFYDLLKLSKGDIIFLADQDDIWEKNKISVMSEMMEKNCDIQTLNSSIQLIDAKNVPFELKPRKGFYNANLLQHKGELEKITYLNLDDMIKRNISPGCSMAINRKIRDEFLRTYDFVLAHDWYMNLLASLTGSCCFLNQKLTNYRIHEENTLGLSSKWDILSKIKTLRHDQMVKLNEFENIFKTFKTLSDNYQIESGKKYTVRNYLRLRVRFIKNPKIQTLFKLRKERNYFESTNIRGRVLDFILTLGVLKI